MSRAASGGAEDPSPVSPCIGVCLLDAAHGLCRGCARSIDEIAAWNGLAAAEKRRIIAELPARRLATASTGR